MAPKEKTKPSFLSQYPFTKGQQTYLTSHINATFYQLSVVKLSSLPSYALIVMLPAKLCLFKHHSPCVS